MENEYRYNKRFQRYVDRYCSQYGYSVEEALEHEIIKQACLYYTET